MNAKVRLLSKVVGARPVSGNNQMTRKANRTSGITSCIRKTLLNNANANPYSAAKKAKQSISSLRLRRQTLDPA